MSAVAAAHHSPTLQPGRWEVDPVHSTIEFRVRHAGVARVRGVFQEFEGVLEVRRDGSAAAVGSITAASLDTRVGARDEHLRSEDFFAVDAHPLITFSTTDIEADGGGVTVRGFLRIRGVTREIQLQGEIVGSGLDDEGAERVGLELAGRLDRRDFGLTWNAVIDGGGVLVGNRVDLMLEVSAVRRA